MGEQQNGGLVRTACSHKDLIDGGGFTAAAAAEGELIA